METVSPTIAANWPQCKSMPLLLTFDVDWKYFTSNRPWNCPVNEHPISYSKPAYRYLLTHSHVHEIEKA